MNKKIQKLIDYLKETDDDLSYEEVGNLILDLETIKKELKQESIIGTRQTLGKKIPQTFGEAKDKFPWLDCPTHEWDNRTTAENALYVIKQLGQELSKATADSEMLDENKKLRELLWLNHNKCSGLYGDDVEMQCNECRIDFKRDAANDIELKIIKRKNPKLYKILMANDEITKTKKEGD